MEGMPSGRVQARIGHEFLLARLSLTSFEPQGECNRLGKVARLGRRQLVGGIGYCRMISDFEQKQEHAGSSSGGETETLYQLIWWLHPSRADAFLTRGPESKGGSDGRRRAGPALGGKAV